MRNLSTLVIVMGLIVVFWLSTEVKAGQIFYSVDRVTDELVSINSATGNVTVVGSLGVDVDNIDLTIANGRLFGLITNFLVRVDLVEINTSTGAVTSTNQVKLGGAGILHGEGLAHIGDQLKIGFRNTSSNKAISESIGDLGLDGAISNVTNLGNDIADFDGLGAGSGNVLYSVDTFFPTSADHNTFFSLDLAGPTLTQFAQFLRAGHQSNDVVSVGSSLYSVSHNSTFLREIDIPTGSLIRDVTLRRSGQYTGIADTGIAVESCPCDLFTMSDFKPPMGKKKKLGSTLSIKFDLFFDGIEIQGQDELDLALELIGCQPDCPQIRIVDVTDPANAIGLELPEDLDNVGEGGDLGDCFRFSDGNWIFNLQLPDDKFFSGSTYLVEVKLDGCVLTVGNDVFQIK